MTLLQHDIKRYYELKGSHPKNVIWMMSLSLFNPRLYPVILLRTSNLFHRYHLPFISKILSMLNLILFGIETSPKVNIGGGLFLPHTVGTILGAESIGVNVTIMHGVTLGAREMDFNFNSNARPIIGNNVFIGAGAKIIGAVTIGDYAKIGANAVVIKDIPQHALAVGVPAKIINES